MQYQRVRTGNPTDFGSAKVSKTKNAVAGVKARNGADRKGSGKRTEANYTAQRPALARRLVALIDRDGTVTGLFRRPDEVRAFLQGGYA
ncbi:hypothetical protein [Methylobacterium sp. Leaf108]|uniref:hypothetical protein n=1 Tax=Methylobacterium sp. Leaf108 TaxID=1736256 RepID=UPI000A9B33D4|nr:hypothetical protein [Methylobacterium sp. Leaf108]